MVKKSRGGKIETYLEKICIIILEKILQGGQELQDKTKYILHK